MGILAFVQPLGAGGSDPECSGPGWARNTLPNSTQSSAQGGDEDLIMVKAVPEPTTLAIAAMGGLSLLGLRRKKA